MARTLEEAEQLISLYELNGGASLFYALNRKMNEVAQLLNSTNLGSIDMASKSDASFERVFKLLEKSQVISAAAESLGKLSGITNDEEKDTKLPKYRMITTPESIADSVGQLAGQNK
jgi:hypothetical protein